MSSKRLHQDKYISDALTIKLQDLLILYFNLHKASTHPGIGFQDSEVTFQATWELLRKHEVSLKKSELEALLWCCIHLDELPEGSQFWHPTGRPVNAFIHKMIPYDRVRVYFDKIYSFFRARKPKQGVPKDQVVTIGEEEDNV